MAEPSFSTLHPHVKGFIKGALLSGLVVGLGLVIFRQVTGRSNLSTQIDAQMDKGVDLFQRGEFAPALAALAQARELAESAGPLPREGGKNGMVEDKPGLEGYIYADRIADACFFRGAVLLRQIEQKHAAELTQAMLEPGIRFILSEEEAAPVLAEINQGLAAAPKQERLWRFLGYVETLQGRYAAAVKALEKAVEINPLFAEAYNDLGVVHLKRQQPEKARENFEKAILALKSEKRELPDVHFNLGMYYAGVTSEGPEERRQARAQARRELELFLSQETSPSPSVELAKRKLKELAGD